MIAKIIVQELQHVLRQKRLWLLLGVFLSFTLWLYHRGLVFVGVLAEGEAVNSPHAIVVNAILFSVLGLAALFPVFNGAALREYQSGFTEMLFAMPLRREEYYSGRFAAGVTLCALLTGLLLGCNVAGVEIGLLTGAIAPEEVAPFRAATFLKVFFYYMLPTILLCGSVVFSVALVGRKTLYGLLSLLFLLLFYFLSDTLASNSENLRLAALADPFGQQAVGLEFRYKGGVERNRQGLSLTPWLLANRLGWGAVGLSFLLLGYVRFRREEPWRKQPAKKALVSGKGARAFYRTV